MKVQSDKLPRDGRLWTSPSCRAAKISVPATAARTTHGASRTFISRLALLFLLLGLWTAETSRAAYVSFGFTNSVGEPDTNPFKAIPVSGPIANADGSFTTIGLPIRITPAADGFATNWLANNNYLITNAFLGQGYYIRVPLDSGGTVYPSGQLRISGGNIFVTVTNGPGGTNLPTFNQLTNIFFGTPIVQSNLPALTNGFITLLEATNVANAKANSSSNSIYSYFNTQLAIQSALSITNIYPTNAAGVSWAAGRAYVSTNYDPLGTALAIGAAGTNYATGISNALFALHSLSLTNLFATNAAGVSYAGGRGYISTNYDSLGAALTIGQQATNYAKSVTNGYSPIVFTNASQILYTNSLPGLTNGFVDKSITNNAATRAELVSATNGISGGGISLATATNIMATATNGYSPLVFTNAAQVLYTNSLPGLTNGFVDKSITNNAATKSYAQSLTNGFVDRSITNGFATQAYARGLTNGFAAQSDLNKKADTNAPTIWTPLFYGPIEADTNNESTNMFGGAYTILGINVIEGNGQITGLAANAHVEGDNSVVINGTGGHAEGENTTVTAGLGAHAEGDATTASFTGSHAEGFGTTSSNTGSHSEGITTVASGTASHAAGQNANATNNNSFVWSDSTTTGSVTNKTFTVFAANGIKLSGGLITGNGGAVSNTTATNFGPAGLVIITNIASAIGGAGISASTGTNISAYIVGVSNSPIVSSNSLLFVAKVDKTNGFATSLVSSNTALEANVAFGLAGQATNIFASTNYLYFVGAGSGIVTNGAFIWDSTRNVYTNWNGCIVTNNGTAALLQTNGVTLYSLAGSSPIGAYSAVNGSAPAPAAYYTSAMNDHMPILGVFSLTNVLQLIQSASNSTVSLFTNGTSTGSIAVSNGFGTNTTLLFANAAWGLNNSVGNASYSAVLSGSGNTISGISTGNVIPGGLGLGIGNSPGNFIGGGLANTIASGGGYSVIGGGRTNTMDVNYSQSVIGGGLNNKMVGIFGGSYDFIGGGQLNMISNSVNSSAILGGQNNIVSGNFSVAAGRNATTIKDGTFIFSDGTISSALTNAQATITATNGLYVNGPVWLGATSTNSGVYYLSNTFSLFAITNAMPNFAHWIGNSNGIMVDIYYSNGVAYMKNNWP